MAVVVDIPEWSHGTWHSALVVLGIERCRLIWPELGVPTALRERPEPAAAAVAPVLEVAATSSFGNLIGVKEVELRALLEGTFSQLAAEYGEAEARLVHDWAQRVFVGEERQRWIVWGMEFNGTARFAGRERFADALWSTGLAAPERVVDIVEQRFGRQTHAERMALLEGVRLQPTPAFEARIRAVDIQSKADDPTYPDLYSTLSSALLIDAARLAWAELDTVLVDDERDLLLAWAKQGAERLGPFAQFLALPDRQAQHADERAAP